MINKLSPIDQARNILKDKEPKSLLSHGRLVKPDVFETMPKVVTCEKHGDFEIKAVKFIGGNYMVNSMCDKCLKEFDALVDIKAKEIEKKEAIKNSEARQVKRIDDLKIKGVSKRHIDRSFDNYCCDSINKKDALDKITELCSRIKNKEDTFNLIMVGGFGTGKTHLANSAVIDLHDNGKCGVRINAVDMIRRLKSTWAKDSNESEEDAIEAFVEVDLLIIDEIGVQFGSDTEKMFMFDIINGRYEECLPTVIISNLDVDGVKEIIGERCIDRLREDGGKVVAFDWESYRRK